MSFQFPGSPSDIKKGWGLPTASWIRWEFHYMDMCKDYLAICSYLLCVKHLCYSGCLNWILCLPFLKSVKGGNISCRSGLSSHSETTETQMWASLAQFLGLPHRRWSNQSKWIRNKMSKYISIQLKAILESCWRAKKYILLYWIRTLQLQSVPS